MSGINMLWLVVAAVLIYIPISYVISYRRYSHIKGPWLATISNLWLVRGTLQGRSHLDCAEALDKYGSIVRVSPNKVVTNDLDLWRLMNTPRSTFTRGPWFDSMTLNPHVKNSLSQRDEKEHAKLRSKLIRGYSGKEIPDLAETIDRSVIELVSLIREHCHTGKPVDIARLSQYFTLDVLTHIAFGHPFGYLSQNRDVYQYIEQVSAFLGVLELSSNFPIVDSLLKSKLMAPFQPRTTDKTGMGAMLGIAHQVVNERYTPGSKQKLDMLGSFIKNGLSKEEAESESMLQILGGSDSTATAIRMTFLYILTNPRVYRTLVNEIDAADTANRLSSPVITPAESHTLHYLQSCIKEGLRIFPPLTGLQGKLPPPDTGYTHKGVFLPPGLEVCWNPLSMQRRPEIYGQDADIFRPERWLDPQIENQQQDATQVEKPPLNHVDEANKLKEMNQALDMVFGTGRSSCLGKTVAYLELDKIFVALFREFEFDIVNPLRPMTTACYGVHVQTDLWCTVRERRKEGQKV